MRVKEWPRALSDYITARQRMPFKWGENDCMAFVAGGVHALTGNDFYPEYSGYETEEGAKEVLQAHGGAKGIMTKHLGEGHDNVMLAQRGDAVLVKIMGEYIGGIVDDTGLRIALVSPAGLVRLPLRKAVRVWSV